MRNETSNTGATYERKVVKNRNPLPSERNSCTLLVGWRVETVGSSTVADVVCSEVVLVLLRSFWVVIGGFTVEGSPIQVWSRSRIVSPKCTIERCSRCEQVSLGVISTVGQVAKKTFPPTWPFTSDCRVENYLILSIPQVEEFLWSVLIFCVILADDPRIKKPSEDDTGALTDGESASGGVGKDLVGNVIGAAIRTFQSLHLALDIPLLSSHMHVDGQMPHPLLHCIKPLLPAWHQALMSAFKVRCILPVFLPRAELVVITPANKAAVISEQFKILSFLSSNSPYEGPACHIAPPGCFLSVAPPSLEGFLHAIPAPYQRLYSQAAKSNPTKIPQCPSAGPPLVFAPVADIPAMRRDEARSVACPGHSLGCTVVVRLFPSRPARYKCSAVTSSRLTAQVDRFRGSVVCTPRCSPPDTQELVRHATRQGREDAGDGTSKLRWVLSNGMRITNTISHHSKMAKNYFFKAPCLRIYASDLFKTGATVVEWLDRSPSTKAILVQSPAGAPDLRMWELCLTMPLVGGFSRGSPVSPALSFRCRCILTSITLIGSQDLASASHGEIPLPPLCIALILTWHKAAWPDSSAGRGSSCLLGFGHCESRLQFVCDGVFRQGVELRPLHAVVTTPVQSLALRGSGALGACGNAALVPHRSHASRSKTRGKKALGRSCCAALCSHCVFTHAVVCTHSTPISRTLALAWRASRIQHATLRSAQGAYGASRRWFCAKTGVARHYALATAARIKLESQYPDEPDTTTPTRRNLSSSSKVALTLMPKSHSPDQHVTSLKTKRPMEYKIDLTSCRNDCRFSGPHMVAPLVGRRLRKEDRPHCWRTPPSPLNTWRSILFRSVAFEYLSVALRRPQPCPDGGEDSALEVARNYPLRPRGALGRAGLSVAIICNVIHSRIQSTSPACSRTLHCSDVRSRRFSSRWPLLSPRASPLASRLSLKLIHSTTADSEARPAGLDLEDFFAPRVQLRTTRSVIQSILQLSQRHPIPKVWSGTRSDRRNRHGATVAERLTCSPPTKAILVQAPARSPGFLMWESCRTMSLIGGFSRGSPVSLAPSFRRCSILTSITNIGSQELDVNSRPNIFTHYTTVDANIRGGTELNRQTSAALVCVLERCSSVASARVFLHAVGAPAGPNLPRATRGQLAPGLPPPPPSSCFALLTEMTQMPADRLPADCLRVEGTVHHIYRSVNCQRAVTVVRNVPSALVSKVLLSPPPPSAGAIGDEQKFSGDHFFDAVIGEDYGPESTTLEIPPHPDESRVFVVAIWLKCNDVEKSGAVVSIWLKCGNWAKSGAAWDNGGGYEAAADKC
ncbi:hypothetical protein PR048_031503 [Dryococelus australis]|uniref:Uncharacterized protein n=1 Tax=Dryococelus australis TaxID=614101 RepID=A0ABQ9G5G2_9NEOP|nr:hypothetical protein PR048_031503 [Dryococelus australis]